MKLTYEQIRNTPLKEIARMYGMKEVDFIADCYPPTTILTDDRDWYRAYEDWYNRTQNKLARALK